jgi:pyruvate/2-oxoglutarate dehydrogenase complex dihydrolipoamide dehydrogenase (E3) component
MPDVIVIGAGPAGVVAAIRAPRSAARTAMVTSAEFGGMAATDGPVPVRALADAARLLRDARQLPRYGITESEPVQRGGGAGGRGRWLGGDTAALKAPP